MKMKMKRRRRHNGLSWITYEPTSVLYYLLLLLFIIIHAIHYYTESTPNLTALRAAVGGSRAPLDRASCITHRHTYTPPYTILYTHIVLYPDPPEIRDLGNGRFSGQNAVSSGGYASKLWATFETSLTSCVFSWVFRAQTFGLILSYIINKLFKIENTKEPIRAFPPADPI
jgi:hypothetical protein